MKLITLQPSSNMFLILSNGGQKDKAKQDERKKGKGFFVEGTETLVVFHWCGSKM